MTFPSHLNCDGKIVSEMGPRSTYQGQGQTITSHRHLPLPLIPGPWFNIKMSSYQYRKSHCGDKTVVRSSYLHNGNSYTGKMTSLYWISPLLLAHKSSTRISRKYSLTTSGEEVSACLSLRAQLKSVFATESLDVIDYSYINNISLVEQFVMKRTTNQTLKFRIIGALWGVRAHTTVSRPQPKHWSMINISALMMMVIKTEPRYIECLKKTIIPEAENARLGKWNAQ